MNREQPGPPSERPKAPDGGVASHASIVSSVTEPAPFRQPSSNGSRRSVELQIEELVLNGFAPADRYAIGEAVERELVRLLNAQDIPPAITQDVEIASLNGGSFKVGPGSDCEMTGIQLAKAIYGGLSK